MRQASILAVLSLATTPLAAQDLALESLPTRWRFSVEHFEIDDDENLGLAGAHLDLLQPFRHQPDLYVGVGAYGAAAGQRGGLFVGGVTLGWLKEVWPGWNADVGIFAGGGGGGGGGEAEGLMLRPHLALEREIGLSALRFELARVDFPDGDIADTHLSFGLTLPSEILRARHAERAFEVPERALVRRHVRVRAIGARLDPDAGSKRRSGGMLEDSIEGLGAGVDYFVDEYLYIPVEALGAVGGGVSGFAMAQAGLGLSLPLAIEDMSLEARGQLGAGGGGDVDTGGGYSWSAFVGLRARVREQLGLELGYGRLVFPDGDFEADTLVAGLTWSFDGTELALDYPRGRLLREGLSRRRAELSRTRIELVDKIYLPASDARKTDGSEYDSTLQLIGLRIEQPVWHGIAITGAAYTAWEGDIGGYAEGFLGLKAETRPFADERHVFTVGAEVGAGGGGGTDVGSGLIYQFSGGYRYEFSPELALALEGGVLETDQGSFDAEMYQVGLVWNLGRALFE
jgi:hypothetical protein